MRMGVAIRPLRWAWLFFLLSVVSAQSGYQRAIRLLNGTEPTEGRIEIFDHNIWWRVCADTWSLEEAKTACYQLDMPTPTQKLPGGMFGVNQERAFLPKMLNCSGEEGELVDCMSAERNETPCETGDAALQCGVLKDEEGEWTKVQRIALGVSLGISVCCVVCWVYFKWLSKPKSNAPESEGLPPNYDEVSAENLPEGSSQTAV